MKLIFMLITVTFVQATATTYAQKVTLKVNGASLKEVFEKIQAQTNYDFLYNLDDIELAKPVSADLRNTSLKQALDICFQNQSLSYLIENTTILISKKKAESKIFENGTISGKVTDEKGDPLPGASVRIVQLKHGATTDRNGNFSISVPSGIYTIEVTFISYQISRTSNVEVFGNKTVQLNIKLQDDISELSEVIVTSLGIKREEKALGYAQTTIKNEQLTDALSNNWTDALSGKVAGVNLVRSNGGPAGSNSIVLRGESNITGSNDALIVVDGVVINNGSGRTTGTGYKAQADADSPTDFGSGLSDINPEDIESVTVLKGPGAAALYGQRGANGAIIITTKSGKARIKGIGVTISSNSSMETPMRFPDYQYEYGQGTEGSTYYSYGASADGGSTKGTSSAYGPKFDGQMYFQYDPVTQTGATERTPWVGYPGAVEDFFETGKTFTNSITLDGGNKNTLVRFSATNVNNTWIVPNTGYKRNTIALSASHKVNEKLKISTKVNYTNKYSDNLPAVGYNNQTIMYWANFMVPNSPLSWIKDYWKTGQEGILQNYPFSANPDNPYLIVNEMLNKSNRHGITGNVQASYDFTKSLSLLVRSSLDFTSEARSYQRPFDTEKFKEGMYRTTNIFSQEITSDFLLRYNKKFTKKFETSFSFGGSHLANQYLLDDITANMLLYPQVFNLANAKNGLLAAPFRSQYVINSLYGLGTLSYNNYIYLDITGRNDWNSVLATATSTDNVSFFYPSVNLSAVVTDMFKLPAAISFAKLRASYAGVGSGRNDPYKTSVGYSSNPLFPGGLTNQLTLANDNLKPLYTTSFELGTDIRLFKNRFGVDLTLYKGNTRDQILSAGLDRATGVNYAIINAGEVQNTGVEIQAHGSPIKKPNGFGWNVFATFASNDNKVVSMTEELPELQLQTGPANSSAVIAKVGGHIGDLYGIGYQRAPDGQIIYEKGYPLRTPEMIYLGNTTAKWRASIGNEFMYKQLKFSFLFDAQYGGSAFSMTHASGITQGKIKKTLPGRDNGIIGVGVIRNPDGSFRPNDVIVENINTYYEAHAARENAEGNTFRTDFIKLRESRLDYTFSSKLNTRLGLQRATIGIYGRDLLIITKWPQFDPEFGTLNNGTIDKGVESAQFPSSRTVGLSLTIGI